MVLDAYTFSAKQILNDLNVQSYYGLTSEDASERLKKYGKNKLQTAKRRSLFLRILDQFKDFLVIILVVAAIVSIIVGDGLRDAIIIIAILLINMIIGITQENRADNALKELKNMSSPKAKVKRDGEIIRIDSNDVVPGDIVILDTGDYIPADLRIIESMNLRIDESSLTGESTSASKDADSILPMDTPLGDRENLAFMGTTVTYGRGAGIVYATGTTTEMGKIADLLSVTSEATTPLQDKLNSMAKALGILCIAVCALVFIFAVAYWFIGIGSHTSETLFDTIIEMLMVSVALAVAAVPEGIAIIATVILAIGVRKMVKSHVIMKKLRAVETLGSTTVICSDKTGTLTQNKMTVVKVADPENVYEVTGVGYKPMGHVISDGMVTRNISLMSEIGVLCNDAEYDRKKAQIIGDPTEGAMLVFGVKLGNEKNVLNKAHFRIQEIPFDSTRKMMSTYNVDGSKVIMNTKGAPDAVLDRCSSVYIDGEIVPMSETIKQKLLAQNERFASEALRVLAFAYKRYDSASLIDNVEDDLTFVGMMCLIDPPREEVKLSIEHCHRAGINIKMVTGDHKITAAAIAKALGIMKNDDEEALDGSDLNALTDEELAVKVKTVNVFARVSPEHKVRIISAIKAGNNIVAMTGDGVNDAPSLKRADIGIAMGITGSDVTKEAADMILTDDNFVSIVSAIEQGRKIYSNIKKVVGYLLGCNLGEILIVLLAIIFGLPIPLVATQLLFLNLLTDALPAFALGMEGEEAGIMRRKPRNPKEAIINRRMMSSVLARAITITVAALGAFLYGYFVSGAADEATRHILAMSMCFFTLVASELLVAYPSKTEGSMISNRNIFSNKLLNISILLSFGILIAVMYVPILNDLFTVRPLSVDNILICSLLVIVSIIGFEISKIRFRTTR
ncbi:MAG: calcium-translocating P-type ATPase, PMCA-type [Oscillospiraceae bacterium]|jgi:Ca2+-transporting ATPase|nr:calcium-translocating P-type ATPase, PMCA-type [Oscillospiraceae bacterium]